MKRYCALCLMLLLCLGDTLSAQEAESRYANPQRWFRGVNVAQDKPFDVFYVLPTCVWDRVDGNGDTLHYANTADTTDRRAMQPSFVLAEQIFGACANFYAPYYRQLTLQSWRSDSLVEARFPEAFADIKCAFDYYWNNINNGRPYMLAGFSQGAKGVVELLKTLSPRQTEQMVAAYVIGYRVTASDTLNHRQIRAATGAADTGVTVCYNSVARLDAVSPVLSPSVMCINPVSWSTTDVPAPLDASVGVRVSRPDKVLLVEGLDPSRYYVGSLDFLFKSGNYHLQELNFYRNSLSENVVVRFRAFASHARP